jgi:PAS domain S-box-containing protein
MNPFEARKPIQNTEPELWSIGVLTLDRNGRIHGLNMNAARLLGGSTKSLRNRPFLLYVGRDYITPFLDLLMHASDKPEPHILDMDLIVERETIPVEICLTAKGADWFQLEIVDLTDSRFTEAHLRESLAQWHSLISNAPDIILTIDPAGTISFLNAPLWGYSIPAVVGTSLYNYLPEQAAAKMRRCVALAFKGNRRSCDVALGAGEDRRWYNLSFGPGKRGGDAVNSTVVIRDITEQKGLEEMLRTSSERYENLAARLDTVREQERARLSREVHDDLGQALTLLKFDLALATRGLAKSNGLHRKLKDLGTQVDNVIERAHRISSDLRPVILDKFGLVAAIQWQAEEIQKHTGLQIKVRSGRARIKVSPEVAIAAFRVAQEALTNVVRHAKASRVTLQIAQAKETLRVSITDDGEGMAHGQAQDMRSMGILGMQERITRLGGEFRIASKPGKGTTVQIVIPVNS